MELKLQENSNSIRNRIVLALIALVGGTLSAFLAQLGVLLMPIVAAPLAMIFILEIGKKRIFTIVMPILLLALDAVFNGWYSFSVLCSILVAVLIAVSVGTNHLAKGECVMAAVILVSAISAVSILMLGCYLAGELDFSAAIEYYRDAVAAGEAEWQLAVEEYILAASDPELAATLTPEAVGAIYDSYVNAIYSFVAITVFAMVGLSCKLFGGILWRRLEDKRCVQLWRFALTPVYAYFYLALYAVQLFVTDSSAFAIALTNLLNVFMVVFAYIGLLFADAFFKMRSGGRGVSKILIIIVVLCLSSLAVNLLSFVGVFATVMLDRAKKEGFGDDGNLGM